MPTWRNSTGQTLSSATWLEAHHQAKLPERRRFAEALVNYEPLRIVDLGCGTGLWLDLLDKVMPPECEFIGLDSDPESLRESKRRAVEWSRRTEFILCDVGADPDAIPPSDLTLAFNVFPYLNDAAALLDHLYDQEKSARLVIRQYDGGLIRIGPMPARDRQLIDDSMRSSIQASSKFRHFDLDRTYEAVHGSRFSVEKLEFEMTQRQTPFPPEFAGYFRGHIGWMLEHLSSAGREALLRFREATEREPAYIVQADLVAVLSADL